MESWAIYFTAASSFVDLAFVCLMVSTCTVGKLVIVFFCAERTLIAPKQKQLNRINRKRPLFNFKLADEYYFCKCLTRKIVQN